MVTRSPEVTYEFVCNIDPQICWERLLSDLLGNHMFELISVSPENRWFRIDLKELEFYQVKNLPTVQSMLTRRWLRFVRPVTEPWEGAS